MGSSGAMSNGVGPYTLARQVGPPSISKFGRIPRKTVQFADHFPRGLIPAARRGLRLRSYLL